MFRTGHSFGAAWGFLPDVISRIREVGLPVAPISDRTSTFAFRRWTKLAEANGLRPIYGCELAVVPSLGDKKPIIDYWTFLAKDHLRDLHVLINKATSSTDKTPSINYEQAREATGVIKISGERSLVNHMGLFIDDPDFYCGLSPPMAKGLYNELKQQFRFIATSDNYYPRPEDRELYRLALGKNSNAQTYPMHILSDDEWWATLEQIATIEELNVALNNRDAVFDRCQAMLQKATLLSPVKDKTLAELCHDGAQRLGIDLNNTVYKERLDRELVVIKEKQFEDYFYIIADMVNWAKQHMIVGPARGSSCGSLVCYLLGITAVDPIPYGLIFERFLDMSRKDFPDIDVDLSDTNRPLVFKYMEDKYGLDHVARLGSVGQYRAISALKQACTGLRIPEWKAEKVLNNVVTRRAGDERALKTLEDTFNDTEEGQRFLREYPEVAIAGRIEGHPNIASQHAAGLVLTQNPIIDCVAIDARTKSVMCDKDDAEALNLLKIDSLGLTQLSVFERTLELIGERPVNGFLESLPLDDPAAFAVLNTGRFASIFQFSGAALQVLTKQITVESLEDLVAITSLARPGPALAGSTWVRRRTGKEPVTYWIPELEPITKNSFGVILYQEQVMRIAREIGGMDWADVTGLRKAMGKSLGNEVFASYWEKFQAGCIGNGIDANMARSIWDETNSFGSYGFNRSHAVAYSIVSYYCCWLKAHYPKEFAAATLDAETDPKKQILLLRELRDEGIDYVPVDIDKSEGKWVVSGNKLIGPLTSIVGFGPAAVHEIVTCRTRNEPLRPALLKRLNGAKTGIDSLYPIYDKVTAEFPDLKEDLNIHSDVTHIKDVRLKMKGDILIIGVVNRISSKDLNNQQKLDARGYALKGNTLVLDMFVSDDTDEMFVQVGRDLYDTLGKEILEKAEKGKSIFCFKGTVPRIYFRMLSVERAKFICNL